MEVRRPFSDISVCRPFLFLETTALVKVDLIRLLMSKLIAYLRMDQPLSGCDRDGSLHGYGRHANEIAQAILSAMGEAAVGEPIPHQSERIEAHVV
jgi:hypothetical protein